jgi:hypothetical protein
MEVSPVRSALKVMRDMRESFCRRLDYLQNLNSASLRAAPDLVLLR